METQANAPIQTLRLSDRDKARLVQAVEAQSAATAPPHSSGSCQRRNMRIGYQGPDVIITLVATGGMVSGSGASFGVVGRNLSRGGMAFIHGRFIHPNSEMRAELPTLDGERTIVEGKIARCRHIGGIVHEVSVKFDAPIDLDKHLTLTPEQIQRHDQERVADLAEQPLAIAEPEPGAVLVVNDYAADRKLLGHHLGNQDLNVLEAVSANAALAQLEQRNFDMAIIELNLSGADGLALIRQFRSSGFVGPIIASGSANSQKVRTKAEEAGADDFFAKPFEAQTLQATVARLLGGDGAEEGGLYSTLGDDQSLRPLLREFIAGLHYSIQTLHDAQTHQNHEQLKITCHQLKGAGSGYGFEPISKTAQLVLEECESDQSDLEDVHSRVRELIQLLRRVQFK